MSLIEQAHAFREAFGFSNDFSVARFQLQKRLINEEYYEVMSACDECNIRSFNTSSRIEFLKELSDLVFVCYQMAAYLGLDLDEEMKRVFESDISNQGFPTEEQLSDLFCEWFLYNYPKITLSGDTVESHVVFAQETLNSFAGFRLQKYLISEKYYKVMSVCEECDVKSFNAASKTELLEKLSDLVFACYQMSAHLGMNLDEAMKRVFESNMSKLGDDGKPLRREDGKVLKGPNYQPPDLLHLVHPRSR